ncbi:putative transposase, Ptta/En/Spm, plant [Helianthus anomalus]
MWRNIPLDRSGWKNVDQFEKTSLDVHLKAKFDLAQVEKDIRASKIKGGIQQVIQKRFSDRKHSAKVDFLNGGGYADIERARNKVPEDMTKENWNKSIHHFLTPEHIKRTLAIATCRGNQRYANRGGSSSYASTSFKESLQRLEMFHKTHTDKDGNFSSSVAEEDYRRLVLQYEALSQRSCEEGGSSSQPDDLAIFENVLGLRRGHTRGIGRKPCLSTSRVALFQSWFQNPDFRNELQNLLSSSYPTKFGSEDVDGEEVDDGSDDDMDII